MTQKDWEEFLGSDEKAKRLTTLPLAELSVFRGADPIIDGRFFLEGERLPEIERNGAPPIALELEHIYNTKRVDDESIAVRLVAEESPQGNR